MSDQELRDALRALADEWDRSGQDQSRRFAAERDEAKSITHGAVAACWITCADDLRALLDQPTGEPQPSVEELIERSSLGTPEVKRARESVPIEVARQVVARAKQMRADNEPCPECGGDRLRADFVTPGRCHVPRAEEPQPEAGGSDE